MKELKTDYLITGSGAVGMAFADSLLAEAPDASMIIVDRYPQPGGHWNVAYPFVRLHQPSAYYGVSSMELSKGRLDKVGLNAGLGELASGADVKAYFDDVMRHHLLPSGRVQYFPMCEYKGDGTFTSLLTGDVYKVEINKKLVDATYLNTSVPATHTPNFTIAAEVQFMPLNDLPSIKQAPAGFVVIGGGKTGIDACLWLLEQKVDPDHITWVVSRDAWLLDRENTQNTQGFFYKTMGAQAAQFRAIAEAEGIDDLFDKLEASGVLLRLNTSVRPTMFHGATISKAELYALKKIKNIVRHGRVKAIEKDHLILDQGTIPTTLEHIHIDCSASALTNLEMKPIFSGKTITPQTVRSYQPVFSAAFIAYIEAHYEEEKIKNELCSVVPLPNHDTDWIRMMAAMMMNQLRWSQIPEIKAWLLNNRLDGFSKLVNDAYADPDKKALLKKMKGYAMPAAMKLPQLLTEIKEATS